MASTRNLGAAFQIAQENDESRIVTNPLPGDPGHRVMTCRYFVDINHWGAGRINQPLPLGTSHPSHPDMYCVESDKIERQVDDLMFFTRVFASIPRGWEQVSSAVVRLPGFSQDPTYAAAQTITSVLQRGRPGIFRLTKSSHGYSAGDNLHVQLTLRDAFYPSQLGLAGGKPSSQAVQGWNVSTTALEVTTDTFDVAMAPSGLAGPLFAATIITGSVRKITSGFQLRPITTRNVTTTIQHDYFLPGVSDGVPTRSLIPLSQPFAIDQGTETNELFDDGFLTANTVPTATQYRALMDANAIVTLDCVLEPYLGPIVDRKTTSYIAQ